ncbi:MAG: hypothetical protein P4N59_14760 [Negativicutes bacterium]|nr:hypothetical protein [Negativicutes bacterium]
MTGGKKINRSDFIRSGFCILCEQIGMIMVALPIVMRFMARQINAHEHCNRALPSKLLHAALHFILIIQLYSINSIYDRQKGEDYDKSFENKEILVDRIKKDLHLQHLPD